MALLFHIGVAGYLRVSAGASGHFGRAGSNVL